MNEGDEEKKPDSPRLPSRRDALKVGFGIVAGAGASVLPVAGDTRPKEEKDTPAKDAKEKSDPVRGKVKPVIAIHGGYTHELHENPVALKAEQDSVAWIIIQAEDYLLGRMDGKHHTAAETAQYAVGLLEESRIFNAGIGARFQRDGDIRRTASITTVTPEGNTVSGSVEGVPGIINPVVAAAFLKDKAAHRPKHEQASFSNVRLSGEPATHYLMEHHVPDLRTGYQTTEVRKNDILNYAREEGKKEAAARHKATGTVGCVVMDEDGTFAAATSTGGTANNVPGRVGDSGTSDGNFASKKGAVSMTGDGEGIRNLAMASGMVNALDLTSLDDAASGFFKKAHDQHVSAAALFIGKGKGDDTVQVRCTDSDAAMVFAYSKGDGKAHVFKVNPGHYYDAKNPETAQILAEAKLGAEYNDFSKIENIGKQRDAFAMALTRENREKLGKSVQGIKARNEPIPFIPPQGVQGIKIVEDAIDMKAAMAEARGKGREGR